MTEAVANLMLGSTGLEFKTTESDADSSSRRGGGWKGRFDCEAAYLSGGSEDSARMPCNDHVLISMQ